MHHDLLPMMVLVALFVVVLEGLEVVTSIQVDLTLVLWLFIASTAALLIVRITNCLTIGRNVLLIAWATLIWPSAAGVIAFTTVASWGARHAVVYSSPRLDVEVVFFVLNLEAVESLLGYHRPQPRIEFLCVWHNEVKYLAAQYLLVFLVFAVLAIVVLHCKV